MDILKKLYRSTRDKKLTGLCGGLAEMLNVDATLVRILLIVATIITSGTVILIYIIAAMVVPKEPPLYTGFGPNGYGPGPGPGPGGYGYNNDFGGQSFGQSFGGLHKGPPPHGAAPNWNQQQHSNTQQTSSQFDSMMDDLEKKALRREIEELKAKLAKYEKGEF